MPLPSPREGPDLEELLPTVNPGADVVVVGELSWAHDRTNHHEQTSSLLVEVQLHLRPLFELKHDLHVLYKAVRVLG